MKIAVIDDETPLRNLLRELLENEGHRVVEAENGRMGLELITVERPDLILCDIKMPVMSGDELFEKVRSSNSDISIIPFIFLSANADEKERIRRLNQGADNCFEKPVDLKLLAAHINSHLSTVERISRFVISKLEVITAAIPESVEHDFDSFKSVTGTAGGYIDTITSTLQKIGDYQLRQLGAPSAAKPVEAEQGDSNCAFTGRVPTNHLDYINICLDEFERRRQLTRSINGEELSWTLIFMVAKAELEKQRVYVSDLYVSVPSAKSTVNARLNSLLDDQVLTKISDPKDGRRQQVLLTEDFRDALTSHLESSVGMVRQMML